MKLRNLMKVNILLIVSKGSYGIICLFTHWLKLLCLKVHIFVVDHISLNKV